MGDDVDRGQAAPAREGGGDLTGSGATPVEQNRLDARTQ